MKNKYVRNLCVAAGAYAILATTTIALSAFNSGSFADEIKDETAYTEPQQYYANIYGEFVSPIYDPGNSYDKYYFDHVYAYRLRDGSIVLSDADRKIFVDDGTAYYDNGLYYRHYHSYDIVNKRYFCLPDHKCDSEKCSEVEKYDIVECLGTVDDLLTKEQVLQAEEMVERSYYTGCYESSPSEIAANLIPEIEEASRVQKEKLASMNDENNKKTKLALKLFGLFTALGYGASAVVEYDENRSKKTKKITR